MTINRRGQRWAVSVYNPRLRKTDWVGTFATAEEAKQAEQRALVAQRSIRSFVQDWLRRSDYAASTLRTYEIALRSFLDRFGDYPFAALNPDDVSAWATGMPHNAIDTVRAVLNAAGAAGVYVGNNPLSGFSRPARRTPTHLVEGEILRLAECAIDAWGDYGADMFGPMIVFTAHARLRLAEVCALSLDSVRDTSMEVERGGAPREVELPQAAVQALGLVRRPEGATSLFTSLSGAPLNKSSIFYYWVPTRLLFGRPTLRFDDLHLYRAGRGTD